MDNLMMIAATEAKSAADRVDGPLEDKLRAAMEKTWRHWMVTDEDLQFKAACVGVFLIADEEGQARIKAELDLLAGMSALTSGMPIDMERLLGDEERPEGIGLMKLWGDVKEASGRR